MARYPRAVWKPLPEAGREFTAQRKRLLVFHSIVGSASSAFGYFRDGTDLESTFIVPKETPGWQVMELTDSADANYHVNAIAISVETEDNGDPDHDPWTQSQLDWMVDLGIWCVRNPEFDIPAQRATGPFGSGIGYHTMWGAPSDWTPVRGKTCPGAVRIAQFNQVVLPRIIAGASSEEDDMTQDQVNMMFAMLGEMRDRISSMHAGNYGESPGAATGDLAWLHRHVAVIVRDELAVIRADIAKIGAPDV